MAKAGLKLLHSRDDLKILASCVYLLTVNYTETQLGVQAISSRKMGSTDRLPVTA